MKIKELIKETVETSKNSIILLKEQPLDSLGEFIPVAMVVTSLIGFIIAVIKFLTEGGVSNQISGLKGNLFDGIFSGFTSGTTNIITSGIIPDILLSLILANLIVLIISYYKTASIGKKIIVSICLGIDLFVAAVMYLFWALSYDTKLSETMEMKILKILTVLDDNPVFCWFRGKVAMYIFSATVIVFVILMLKSEHNWMIKKSVVAMLNSYIVIPGILLIIENVIPGILLIIDHVIPMIVGVAMFVFIGAILIFVCGIFLSGCGSSSTLPDSSQSNRRDHTSSENSRYESTPTGRYQEEGEYDFNTTFWRDEGGYGVGVPMADCIYMKDSWGVKKYVCTVKDFEEGNFVIINKKRRVMDIAGCRTPKR